MPNGQGRRINNVATAVVVCSWKIENKLDMDSKHVLPKYEAGINDCLTTGRVLSSFLLS